jgi:hypothetical protein
MLPWYGTVILSLITALAGIAGGVIVTQKPGHALNGH